MSSPFVYLPHRAVLSLSGPDTVTLLERLVTHATDNWTAGETRYGALLTPQGKILADYLAVRTQDGVLIDVSKDQIADLTKRLKMFRLRSQVEIELLEDLFVVAGIEPAPEGVRPISGAQLVYLDPRYPDARLRGFATKESWAAWYGYHPAEWSRPIDQYHFDRIAHLIPEQDVDFATASVFPADINMDVLGGVALNKGCFVGQEVVSRMHRRGQIRKRTLNFAIPADGSVTVGTDIVAAAPVGTVTSLEGNQALGVFRVDRLTKAQSEDQTLSVNETPVTIEIPAWLAAERAAMEAQ